MSNQEWLEDKCSRPEETNMVFPDFVLVRIYRPEGYEDVCDDLVVEDAMRGSDFRYEIIKKDNSTFDSTAKSGAA